MSSGGTRRTDGQTIRKTLLRLAAGVAIVVALLAAAWYGYGTFVAQPRAGDIPSGVACDALPSSAEVLRALEEQADLVKRLEALDENVMIMSSQCSDAPDSGSEVVILVPSKAVSDAVQDVLRTEPFTVPVSIRNV